MPIKPVQKITLGFVDIEYHQPDLVIYHYLPKTNLTWEMLQLVHHKTSELVNYKSCYMCSIIGAGLTIEKEAREKGTSTDIHRYTKAAAIVENSLAHRILANFIIRVQRPPVATKVFNTLADALLWIDKQRELDHQNNQTKKEQNLHVF